MLTQCNLYSINEDKCIDCKNGFYLNEEGTQCLTNPTGIYGCIGYIDSNLCSLCGANKYLQDNKCLEI